MTKGYKKPYAAKQTGPATAPALSATTRTAIITYTPDSLSNDWSLQFCRDPSKPWASQIASTYHITNPPPNVRKVIPIPMQNRSGVYSAFASAVQHVQAGGHIVYSAGHGGTRSEILQELAHIRFFENPNDKSFDVNPRTLTDTDVVKIGNLFLGLRITITFLVCMIGNDTTFMRQLKAAWHLASLRGYGDLTEITDDANEILPEFPDQSPSTNTNYPRARLQLSSAAIFTAHNPLGVGSARLPRAWLELPWPAVTV